MAPTRAARRTTRATTNSELDHAASLDAASDFHSPSLAALDHALRCPICAELFSAPVLLTGCSHSFDSRCLREYLVDNKRCPSCLQETNEDKIRLDLALQGAVAAWKDARADLLRLQTLASSRTPPAQAGPSSPTPTAPPPTAFAPSTRTPSAAAKGKRKASALASSAVKREPPDDADAIVVDDGSSDVEIIEDVEHDGAAARRPPRKMVKGPDGRSERGRKGKGRRKELAEADPTDPSLILDCPLCGGSIKNALMALHVERCNGVPPAPVNSSAAWGKLLGAGSSRKDGESDMSEPDPHEKKLGTTQHLPLASYAHKSVSELNEMLKAYDLPTSLPASKEPLTTEYKLAHLIRRHRHFLVLWNANADLAPTDPAHKTARGVRDELKRWERTQDTPYVGAGGAGESERRDVSGKAHAKQYAADFREHIARARASALAAKQAQQQQQKSAEGPREEEVPRPATPPAAEPQPAAEVAESAVDAQEEAPAAGRKRSVRVMSPPRSSPPPPARSSPASSTSSSPPPLPLSRADSPLVDLARSPSPDPEGARSPSPFDAERPPRASQRNRAEERMFAELAAREEQRALAGSGGSDGGEDLE